MHTLIAADVDAYLQPAPTREIKFRPSDPDVVNDDDIGLLDILINTQPDRPGGRIVFSTADYATEEEAMIAMEAFLMDDAEDDDALVTFTPNSAPT